MRRESFGQLAAPLAVVLVLVGGLVWFSFQGDEGSGSGTTVPEAPSAPPQDEPGAADADAADADGGVRQLSVWLDGWSHRTVGSSDGVFVAASSRGERLGTLREEFTPASLEDLSELLARDPAAVERLMARMVRFDVELSCSLEGCSSQRGEVPLEWLASPALVPNLGEMYSAWGVEHGVWVARLDVPERSETLASGFSGWRPAVLPAGSAIVSEEAPRSDDGSDGVDEDGDASAVVLGHVRDVAMSAAFGTVFPLVPNWINEGGIWANTTYAVVPSAAVSGGVDSLPASLQDPSALWRGLSYDAPQLASLSPSVLTMLSSPTIGCNGALCVPGQFDTELAVSAGFPVLVCPHEDFPERSGFYPDAQGLGFVSQFSFTLDIPHPVRQMGVDIPPADQWEGAVPGGAGPFTGDPPLVSGPTEFRVQQVLVAAGDPAEAHLVYSSGFAPDAAVISEDDWSSSWWQLTRCGR